MEEEGQKWEQDEVEEEEEEESTLQVRKSRTEIEVGINGSSENNGHEIQLKNGAENSTDDYEQILEEFDAILEEEIRKEKSDNCCYYDKDEGIWKCRICEWTYQSESFCVDRIQNHNGHLHKLMNDKILTNSYCETEDGAYTTEVCEHVITTTKLEVHMGESHNGISSVKDSPVIQGRPVDIAKDIKQVAAEIDGGLDAVLTIDAPPAEATASQSTQDIVLSAETSALHSGTQIFVVDCETETRKAYEIEVIKSIVYGGLAETITSLSIVSSAAGGDAATLNVIALVLAKLIGGLFVIIHDLWDLKRNRVEQVSNHITEHGERYRELLGRRENFVLHAAVAILSYLIFGLVPPLTYGFSFLKSDDKEFKLLAVSAASLICIVMLAIGKAHCQRPQKSYWKTVVPYVTSWLMVSGVSYAAGMLIKRLLEKLRLLESSSVANLLPETTPTHSSWASY